MTIRRERSAGWERAVEARDQWEQAIADGRGHAFISEKWEVYLRIANLYRGPSMVDAIERWVAAGRPE